MAKADLRKGRILIDTPCLRRICEVIQFSIWNKIYSISIVEEGSLYEEKTNDHVSEAGESQDLEESEPEQFSSDEEDEESVDQFEHINDIRNGVNGRIDEID